MTAIEPTWVSADQVLELNGLMAEATGFRYDLRDRGLLESACARPANIRAYEGQEDVFELALVLMMAIARNHPFSDGNKRAAFEAALLFLELNGYEVVMEDDVAFADLFCAAIAREVDERALIPWLRRGAGRPLSERDPGG